MGLLASLVAAERRTLGVRSPYMADRFDLVGGQMGHCLYDQGDIAIQRFIKDIYKRGSETDIRSVRQIDEYFETLGKWCYWCCGPFECIDHVMPRKLGGSDMLRNLVPSCRDCNGKKSDLDPEYWCKLMGIRYPLPL